MYIFSLLSVILHGQGQEGINFKLEPFKNRNESWYSSHMLSITKLSEKKKN